MTAPVDKIPFGQLAIQHAQGVTPKARGIEPGVSSPISSGLGISMPGKTPFGTIKPVVQNEKVANRLDLDA